MDLIKLIIICLTIFPISCKAGRKGRRFEIEKCEEIIPHFIDHIKEHGRDGECDAVGQFPKPGDCTVFFRCIRGRGRISRFVEYCAVGYTFDGNSCVPSNDITDCPQFNCNMLQSNTTTDTHKILVHPIVETSTSSHAETEVTAAQQVWGISQNNAGTGTRITDTHLHAFLMLLVLIAYK